MEIEKIRDAYHAKPFRPFQVVVKDGRKLEVYDDCCMTISPTGRQFIVLDRRGRWTVLQPPEIDSLEFAEGSPNGASASTSIQ